MKAPLCTVKRVLSNFTLLMLLAVLLAAGAGAQEAREPNRVAAHAPRTESHQQGEAASPLAWEWVIERVDTGKTFEQMGDRSLVLDANGHPHIAYGGDHLYYAWHDGSTWQLETADAAWGVGKYASLALDSAGRPHIAYFDSTNGALKYAHYDGSTWQIETVDGTASLAGGVPQALAVYRAVGLALDAANRPHISYRDNTTAELKYAYHDGSAWQIQTVDSAAVHSISLVLDAAGLPHVGYFDYGYGNLKYAYHDGSAWHVETVDGSGLHHQSGHTSLALDSSGQPRISYFVCSPNYDLRYAHYDGVQWITETVDSQGWVGEYTSLALDSSSRPHISYSGGGLKYAYYDGTIWRIEMVDNDWYAGYYTSLALSGDGYPNISYFNRWNYGLTFARNDGTAWHIETVDSGGDVGRHTAIVLDASDQPHMSYCRYRMGVGCHTLEHAWYSGTAWQLETVDGDTSLGSYTSVALDASGSPRISYEGGWGEGLKYAYQDLSGWHLEVVDTVGRYTSLALDQAGQPRISYYDYANANLRYVWYDGANWFTETVDGAGDVGEYSSLALDTSGRPHIAYFDSGNGDLQYAWYDGTSWYTQTVESAGYVGDHTSLVLDSYNFPHISYSGGGQLRYASYDGTSWITETVDSSGGVLDTSLGLDATDRPRIGYYVWTTGDLKYAWHDGTTWHIETVDSAGDVGTYTSLALDSSGRPHISYYDTTNGDLKYAYVYAFPVEGLILPAGGTVSSPVDETEHTFPAGAFSETVRVVHCPRNPARVPAPGGHLTGIGHFYSVTAVYSDTGAPADLVPGTIYTVTIGYTEDERGSVIEDSLALYYWDGVQWVQEPTSAVNPAANTLVATPSHLSLWGVLGETRRVFLPLVLRNY